MSRTLVEHAWDDFDRSIPAMCTDIELSFDGTSVRLDLSDENYKELEAKLGPYLKVGTPKSESRTLSGARSVAKYNKAMREWGDANGLGLGVGYTAGKDKSAGVYYYRKRLRNAYAEHTKQQASG